MGRIDRFMSRTEADLARTVLEDAGIPAYVSGDDAGGLHPEIPFGVGGTAVVVPDDRHREACDVLDLELDASMLREAELAAMGGVDDDGVDASPGGAGRSPSRQPSLPRAGTDRRVLTLVTVTVFVVVLVFVLPTVLGIL